MKGLYFSIVYMFVSLTAYGTSDIFFRPIASIPKGDTDISDVNVERVNDRRLVVLNKTLEEYRSECSYIYYNLFYPEIANDSTLIIYKARIKIPKNCRFKHGRYGSSGKSFFCFGNQKEWFVILFNISSEEVSSGITYYSEEDILDDEWLRYDYISKDEVFYEIQYRHPNRSLSRASLLSNSKNVYGLCKLKRNVLYFNVKNKHKRFGEDYFSSFEILEKKNVAFP